MEPVGDLLRQTISEDGTVRSKAEAKLKALFDVQGFLLHLLRICSNSADSSVPICAAILLKNRIKACYRSLRPGQPEPPERAKLKHALLSVLAECSTLLFQVEQQLYVAVGLIARLDWPHHWPQLFPCIASIIKKDQLQRRGFCLLRATLEDLSNLRMQDARAARAKVCESILATIGGQWSKAINVIITTNEVESRTWQMAKVLTQCVRLLLAYGTMPPYPFSQTQVEYFPSLLKYLKALPTRRAREYSGSAARDNLSEMSLSLAEALCNLAEFHPVALIPYVKPFVLFACEVLQHSKKDCQIEFEDFSIYCIRFLRAVYNSPYYRSRGQPRFPIGVDKKRLRYDEEEVKAAGSVLHGKLKLLTEVVVTQLMPLTGSDLKAWEQTPEEFFHDDHRMRQYERLRPASESLFWDLIKSHRNSVMPILVDMLKHTIKMPPFVLDRKEISPERRIQEGLTKDSLYYALGIASVEISENLKDFPFGQWYVGILSKELGTNSGVLVERIIRRRVAWLLGEYARQVLQLQTNLKQDIYTKIFQMLSDKDIVVRLSALLSLKNLMEALPTAADYSLEFGQAMDSLIKLTLTVIMECKEAETKSQVLLMLQYILPKTDPKMLRSSIPDLMKCIPALWRICNEQNVVRNHILYTLKILVGSCGSQQILPLLLDLLSWCLDPKASTEREYLHEAALQLWVCIVQNSHEISGDLLNFFGKYWYSLVSDPDIADQSQSYVEGCIDLVRSYALRLQQSFISPKLASVLNESFRILSTGNSYRTVQYSCAIDALLLDLCLMNPKEFIQLFHPYIRKILKEIAVADEQRHGADVGRRSMLQGSRMSQLVLCNHFHLLARLFVLFPDQMAKLIFASVGENAVKFLHALLQKWLDTFFCIMLMKSSAQRCRANAAAFCSLINSRGIEFPSMVFFKLVEAVVRATDKQEDSDAHNQEDDKPVSIEEAKRRQSLEQTDPVRSMNLKQLLRQSLNESSNAHGPAKFNEILRNNLAPNIYGKLTSFR